MPLSERAGDGMKGRQVGAALVIVGGALFILALAVLPYITVGSISLTLWQVRVAQRLPYVFTGVAAAAILLSALAVVKESRPAAVITVGCAFLLFGRVAPINETNFATGWGTGLWVATAMTVVMIAGSVTVVLSTNN
jgi:hypothetical protein